MPNFITKFLWHTKLAKCMEDTAVLSHCPLLRCPGPKSTGVLDLLVKK